MLRSVNELKDYTIAATDGDIGSVRTFYFDDEHWTIRHLVVDTGGWLGGRRVLISPIAIGEADWSNHRLAVQLTKAQIEQSPDIDLDQPISRQYEVEYYGYYGWPLYWGGTYAWAGMMYPGELATPRQTERTAAADQEHADPHLRSSDAVIGYHIQATDGEIGHVDDFLVDDQTWQIRYMAVDTSNWWFGKKVLIAAQWITQVSWDEQKVSVDLLKEAVKGSPAWDLSALITRNYEEHLYRYYDKSGYWQEAHP